MTVLASLVAKDSDSMDYITYVFKLLESNSYTKYVMCVRYPNWNHRAIKIGDTGFLEYKDITAGIDTWYDGEIDIKYKTSHTQFLKFVPTEEENEDKSYIM